jgi:hypothetical protein
MPVTAANDCAKAGRAGVAAGIHDEGFTDYADLGDYADQGRDDGLMTKWEVLLFSSSVILQSHFCVNQQLQ